MTLHVPHANLPLPGGLLEQLLDRCTAKGWDPKSLASFRMEADGDGDGASGDASGDGDKSGSGDGGDDSGQGKGSKGGEGEGDTTDWKAEAEKWKAQSRKHEDRAKANAAAAKERDELKKQTMGEQEKAIEEAKTAVRNEVLGTVGAKLVDAEIRAVSAGRLSDTQRASLLEGLERSKFLTDDGDVDTDKVSALIDGLAPTESDTDDTKNGKKTFPDTGQGRRQGAPGKGSVAAGRDLYEGRRATTSKS